MDFQNLKQLYCNLPKVLRELIVNPYYYDYKFTEKVNFDKVIAQFKYINRKPQCWHIPRRPFCFCGFFERKGPFLCCKPSEVLNPLFVLLEGKPKEEVNREYHWIWLASEARIRRLEKEQISNKRLRDLKRKWNVMS